MTRTLEIKTTHAEPQTLPLITEDGETLTMTKLQTLAASLLPDKTEFSLHYTDSDGDQVTLTTDADVNELEKYMYGEQLQTLGLLVVPRQPPTAQRAATAVQTQLRGLATAMSKLTAKPDANPTPVSAMNLLVASLQAMDVSEDAGELATIKTELLLVLQDDELRKAVEELSAAEEFKDIAHAMVTAIYDQDAQAIEDAATARFDELLAFAQRVVARCPALKPVMVSVAKALMAGLVRYNDEDMDDEASDSSSSSSSSASSCCSDDHETLDVEVFTEQVPLHLGVVCNGCKAAPLVGVRYKSLEVPHFDLCEGCEASGNYMRFEPFVKITDPSRAPKQKRTSELVHPFVTCDGCEMSPIVGVRFKSDTKEDFDLCEGCETSGKWTESHGPFTKIEDPCAMRAMKFACRRGEKFGHHGRFGHHHGHGHHGEFGRHHGKSGHHHGCHEKFGRRHDDSRHHHHGKFAKFGRHGHHHNHHHGHDFNELPFSEHGSTRGFPGHGSPFHHEGRSEYFGHGRPDFHGHHGHGPPPEFASRHRHRGHPRCGPPGHFGRFGLSPFDFVNPRGPPMCPHGFEHDRPPFPAHRDFHHGRHTRFADEEEDEQQQEGRCHRRRHGCGRGRWGDQEEAITAQEISDTAPRTNIATDANMEVEDAADVRAESGDGNVAITETEVKANYSDTLAQLASMGFDDVEKNIRALELTDGNVGGAVNVLLLE